MTPSITKSTPVGCMVGLGAIFCSLLVMFGILGVFRWFDLPDDDREYNHYFWTMLGLIIGGGLVTIILCVLSWKSLKSFDSDKNDLF